jgi:2-polyprenyl-3-methyl-5-hydroxy-6-metoxy-1,4-benzoquinol methylase
MSEGTKFLKALETKARMFYPSAQETYERNQDLSSWMLNPLARWAGGAYGDKAFEDAAKGYARYCLGVWKCQQEYEKNGRYTQQLAEIKTDVYESEGYMIPYMWAAILIYPLWPSMISHIALYREDFVKALPSGGRVLELACGHGVLSLLAAEERPDLHMEGSDISAPAIAVANRLRGVSGHESRVTFEVKDVLDLSLAGKPKTYQGIVGAMVAEHLEDPRPLFKVISHHLADDGLAYFSTALESAQRDHTYEFHHESEPLKMAEDVGLRVTKLVSDAGTPVPGGRFLPRALGMILRRR